MPEPTATIVFDTYWRFAARRQDMYIRRLTEPAGPWTDDPILSTYRFTNAYRAADRVSQYLLRHVLYRDDLSQAPDEIFFRTLLFKIFNKIETWELLEAKLGRISWQSADLNAIERVLDDAMAGGAKIYSAAYIMPAPPFGRARKHANHLALIDQMMSDGLPAKLSRSRSFREVYEAILTYPGIGRFLAFQYAIDLNYSNMLEFSEADLVVAGPGALDGISKCFIDTNGLSAEEVIEWICERQDREFTRLGLSFSGLFGRPLQLIDSQNLLCEISKYARVAHPDVAGVSGRTRIKQMFHQSVRPQETPMFPPRSGLSIPSSATLRSR